MALNSEQTFSLDLSLFSGKVSGIAAGNLPAGASPDCADVFFLPQQVATRPAIIYALENSISSSSYGLGAVDVMSHDAYSAPDGLKYIMALDSAGNINQYNVLEGTNSVLGVVEPGSRFCATQAFSKFFMAFFDGHESANFSDSAYVGTDIPRYINSLGQLNRVTVDGPGGGMTIGKTSAATMTVSALSRSGNTVTAVTITTPDVKVGWFVNPVDSQGQPGQVPGGVTPGLVNSINETLLSGNSGHDSRIILSSGATSLASGNVLTVFYNLRESSGSGEPDYDLLNAFNVGPITIKLTNLEQYGFTSGTYPCVYVSSTFIIPPPSGTDHWCYFSVTYGSSGAQDSGYTIHTNTTATYQRSIPALNTANELFQFLGNVTLVGDGVGNVNVTCANTITNLPVGAWLYLNIVPPTPAEITAFTVDPEYGTITVPGTNWAVGTQILINGFLGGQSGTPQPTGWNGNTYTITGVSGDTYTFPAVSPAGSGSLIALGGTATPVNSFYPSQWIQVTQVISPTQFVYFAVGNTQQTQITGTLYDYFGALNTQLSLTPPLPGQPSKPNSSAQNVAQGFQVLSIVGDTITWYQAGPDDTYVGAHTVKLVPQTAVTPGPRNAFVYFITQDGGASPGSPPIAFNTNGGSFYPTFSNIPLGPPGTVARGLGITPAYGTSYFTLPAELQLTGYGPVVTPGIIILDNTTTSVTLDWSDVALVDSIPVSGTEALGSDYGDLTSTINLPPCLGVIAYDQTLAWFGEINNIKNLLNMSFQGGTPVITAGVPSGLPPGWNDTTAYNGITPDGTGTLALASDGSGWVYLMGTGATSGGGANNVNLLVDYAFPGVAFAYVNDNISGLYSCQIIFDPGSLGSRPPSYLIPTGTINIQWVAPNGTTVLGSQYFVANQPVSPLSIGGYSSKALASPMLYPPLGWKYIYLGPDPQPPPDEWADYVKMDLYTAGATNSMISQPAYQNVWGAPILLPNTVYQPRLRAQLVSGTPGGQLNFVVYSPTEGVLASSHVLTSALPATLQWVDMPVFAGMPASIPSDTVIYIALTGNSTAGVVAVADMMLVNANQPVLQNQVRFSYADNEFGYDNENGFVVGLSTSDAIVSAFVQRQFLYLNTENDLFITQSHGSAVPSEWPVSVSAVECGGSGPNGVTSLQDLAWWFGRQGVMVFNGTEPKKISQEVQPDFDATNWNALVNTAVSHDANQRVVYFSIPTGTATSPSLLITMNHRMADPAVNIMDPVHISTYTGKMIATDLARKWSPTRLPINSVKPCWVNESGTIERVMTFGSGGGLDYGQVYYQDFANYPPTNPAATSWNSVDADFGQISSYYFTYFFFAHDIEQNALLALYRKLFAYMSIHALGTGVLNMTPYVDSMATPWTTFPGITLALADPGIDYEFPTSVLGNRMALKLSNTTGAFQLTHMIVSARRDLVFPVRGAF